MRWCIMDDGQHTLGPMTDLRAVFHIRTGIHTTLDRWIAHFTSPPAGLFVPPHLAEITRERAVSNDEIPVNQVDGSKSILLINGRWLLPQLEMKLLAGEALLDANGRTVLAAHLSADDARGLAHTGDLPDRVDTQPFNGAALLTHPWDVIRHRDAAIAHDAARVRMVDALIPEDFAFTEGDYAVDIHETARIAHNVYFDSTHGPIVVDREATIRPGVILCGPCAVGRGSSVLDHALIKPNTVIGPVCKVAGEIGGTIFQSHSNKAHDGHLGDAWVGEWANFGAGTTNSNLLNTYGEIVARTEVNGQRQRTGLNFFGGIIGDHVKFAIISRLMTGSIFGTGAMIASTAAPPTTVKRFAWITDDGERTYAIDKFIDVARTMMGRRKVTLTLAMEQAIRALHAKHASLE